MLYRGLTRAHMMACVVNEYLRGGFLEFLGNVRLQQCGLHPIKPAAPLPLPLPLPAEPFPLKASVFHWQRRGLPARA